MTDTLDVIDSGVVEGRLNIALGQALVERHAAGELPDTLRFLRFPPTALVGRHQALRQEVDVEWCRNHDIGIVRRITGGGAIYLDPDQLGWELVLDRRHLPHRDLASLAASLCEAAAAGLQELGVDARYRPRNDIEVEGRKISGTGGFFDGDTLFFQGTVLVDLDPVTMTSALRVPRAKLARHDLDAAEQRVVTLRQLLGDDCPDLDHVQAVLSEAFAGALGKTLRAADINGATRALAQSFYEEEIGTDSFVDEISQPAGDPELAKGFSTGPGGTIEVYVRRQGPGGHRLGAVLVTGDFFVTPPRVIYDLEAALRGIFVNDLDAVLHDFFEQADIDSLSVRPEDFTAALKNALESSGPADA
jgi:lipoate-protein ligase A